MGSDARIVLKWAEQQLERHYIVYKERRGIVVSL